MKRLGYKLSGQPGLNSYEDVNGLLSWDYSTGVDCRFPGVVTLAPLLTNLDFSAQVDTAANTCAIAFSEGITSDTVELGVFASGRRAVAVNLSTRVVQATSSAAAFSSRIIDLDTTRNAAGTQEMSATLHSNIYQVITAFNNAGSTYTASANNESIINRFHIKSASFEGTGQVIGLGQASSVENIIRHNVLTGTTTMDASAWVTRVTMSGPNITFTGVALDGEAVIVGTNFGPWYYNNEFFYFQPMLPSLLNNPSTNHCKGMKSWEKLGVVIPLERETRLSVGLESKSVGPERFQTNLSPVNGRLTAMGFSDQWGLGAFYNPVTDKTYLCYFRPRQPWEEHGNPVSWYPTMVLADGEECEAIEWAGTKGSVTNPTWYIGRDSNACWLMEGRGFNHSLDTTATYAASGTIYLTEVLRSPEMDKSPRVIGVRTDGCSTNETLTFTIRWTDKLGQAQSIALTAVSSDGYHLLRVPKEKWFWTEAFTIEIAFARGGTTTNTPRIIRYEGHDVVVWYEEQPIRDRQNKTVAELAA